MIDCCVNQQNSNQDLVRQAVTRYIDNVHEESARKVEAALDVIHTYTKDFNIDHIQMFIISPYQAQCNLIV